MNAETLALDTRRPSAYDLYDMYNAAQPAKSKTTVSEARQGFAEIVNRVAYGNERVVVARHGRDLVAIVPMSDLHRLEGNRRSRTP